MKLLTNKTKKIIFTLLLSNLFLTGQDVYSQTPVETFTGSPSVYVIPHILEAPGKITKTPNTFDTTISVTYTAGLVDSQPSNGATVDLYIFDQATGDFLLSKNDEEVCSPCSFDLGPGEDRKLTIKIEDLINEAGGFPKDKNLFNGFAILSADVPPNDISFDYTVEVSQRIKLRTSIIATDHNSSLGSNSRFCRANNDRLQIPNPIEIYRKIRFIIDVCSSIFGSNDETPTPTPQPTPDSTPQPTPGSIPQPTPTFAPKPTTTTTTTERGRIKILDKEAPKISNTTSFQCSRNNFDTTINLFNQSGIKEWAELQNTTEPSLREVGQPIDIDLYLFDDKTGLPLRSAANNEVCNPCRINLGTAETRKRLIRIDDLFINVGHFPRQLITGYAAIVVNGDADNVNVQSFIVNSKSSPFDISVFGFEPDELKSPSQ